MCERTKRNSPLRKSNFIEIQNEMNKLRTAILCEGPARQLDAFTDLVDTLADICHDSNRKFDRNTFEAACTK